MNNKLAKWLVLVLGFGTLLNGCGTPNAVQTSPKQQVASVELEKKTIDVSKLPYLSETTGQTVDGESSIHAYPTVQEMVKTADVIAVVKVSDQKIVNIDEALVNTQSTVDVKEVIKGNQVPSQIKISEVGGPVDMSKVTGNEKRPGQENAPHLPPQGIIEDTFEGSAVMKKGHEYVVLLVKNPNFEKWGYNIVGSIQGKLRIDESKDIAVATVDAAHLKTDVYFFQRDFAGENKAAVIKEIRDISQQ